MEKDFVKLRIRERESGLKAILLQYYYKGKRREESLRLYLVPELTAADKRKNKETLRIAENVRARRQTELNDQIFKLRPTASASYTLFELLDIETEKRKENSRKNWFCLKSKLKDFAKGRDIDFNDIDERFVERFILYLDTKATSAKFTKAAAPGLRQNTKVVYLTILRALLNAAVKIGLLASNPLHNVAKPRKEQTDRAFLTLEELERMIATPCRHNAVKTCFLFSCLTGLRCSDIIKLTWGEVSERDGVTRLTFRQQKTKGLLYLDLNPQAVRLMGKRKGDAEAVFDKMPTNININKIIHDWTKCAGIDKHITFHSGRHTFATLLLSLNTDLYTVSKLLGHTDVKTTQIYAKVLDKKRQEAVGKIPDLGI